MGRHSAPDTDLDGEDRTVPILRMPQVRTRPAVERQIRTVTGSEQQVPGVLFPIVDDLSMIAADDQMLDSIASGRSDFGDVFASVLPMASGYSHPVRNPIGVLEPLLITWRCELAEAPLPATPCPPAVVRVMRAPADKPPRRSIRPMVAAAAAICALLIGSTAVGARSAEPGDPLWALSEVLYSGHAASVVAKQDARDSLNNANDLLSHGDAPQALVVLTSASGQLERIELGVDRQGLQTTFDFLWVKAHTEAEAAASSAATPGRGTPAIVAALGAATDTGSLRMPDTSAPATPGSSSAGSSVTTTAATTTPSRPGSTAPVVIVPPPTRSNPGQPTAPVQPTRPVTTPPQQSSAPPVQPTTTAPVVTPPPSVPVTTPPTSVTQPPSSDPGTTSPAPPSTDPVTSDTTPAATEVSTTSEMPSPTSADSSADPLAANGAAPAQVTDASQ